MTKLYIPPPSKQYNIVFKWCIHIRTYIHKVHIRCYRYSSHVRVVTRVKSKYPQHVIVRPEYSRTYRTHKLKILYAVIGNSIIAIGLCISSLTRHLLCYNTVVLLMRRGKLAVTVLHISHNGRSRDIVTRGEVFGIDDCLLSCCWAGGRASYYSPTSAFPCFMIMTELDSSEDQ